MELLLLVYCGLFGLKEAPELKNNIVRTSGTILALALILAPFLFDPSDYKDHDHKEDYEEWKHWLYSSGDESWEAWWGKEISHIQTFEGKAIETILNLRFFIFQYVLYQRVDVLVAKASLMSVGFTWRVQSVGSMWLALVGLLVFYEILKTRRLSSVNVQLLSKLIQSVEFIIITCVCVLFSVDSAILDILILIFIPTGWGILSICVVLKPEMKMIGLWKLVVSLARFYDDAIGSVVLYIIWVKVLLPVAPNKAGLNGGDDGSKKFVDSVYGSPRTQEDGRQEKTKCFQERENPVFSGKKSTQVRKQQSMTKAETSTPTRDQNIALQCPKLNESSYTTWAIMMETILKAYGLWETLEDTEKVDERKMHTTKAMILTTLPEDILMQVAQYETAKEVWESIKV
ncbi:callose synthase 9-like protein isoform X2 [Tanacetum coccineum]|uniref:Callose synthase 9-like protein isoform X2 n=1 Tax=Tanacetum coccineum TaxID=301880 RepID=A0ABQ5IN10_9ASTR